MNDDTATLAKKAKEVIDQIIYITLATVDSNGEPWNSPVYTAYDGEYNFYWMSWKDNQHSKNILDNGNVFGVIYDSTATESTGFGVYMKGKAKQLTVTDSVEIARALLLLYGRKSKKPRTPEEFLDILPRRVYKFSPEHIWVNGEGNVDGNFVDMRVDITTELL